MQSSVSLRGVIVAYVVLLVVVGILSFALATGTALPPPQEMANILSRLPDQAVRDRYLEQVYTANARFGQLGSIALAAFQTLLGAVIGTLSSAAAQHFGATKVQEKEERGSKKDGDGADGA